MSTVIIEKRVVISVDFGTSRSGFSIIYRDNKSKIWQELDWADAPTKYCKTLTQLLYDVNGKPVTYGFEALRVMAQQYEEDGADFTKSKYRLFKYFKMGLFNNPSNLVKDENGMMEKQVMDVIVDYLTCLNEKIKEYMRKNREVYSSDEITWCLTIPAIWEDKQKGAMRNAAKRAGLILREKVSENDFKLVLEPEAAAVYCVEHQKQNGNEMRDGTTLLIVDAGGGTVDLTAHRIEDGRLREITKGSGGDCGSSYLDKAFWKLLCDRFGANNMEEYKTKHPFDHFKFMNKWEAVKCDTKTLDKATVVECPSQLMKILERTEASSTYFNSIAGTIKLASNDMKLIFSSVVSDINTLIEKQIQSIEDELKKKVDFIFIVGGFGNSDVLYDEINNKFELMVNKNIIRPGVPGEAIVNGAALLGLDDSLIKSRRMRMSYGVKATLPFDPAKHRSDKMRTYSDRSGQFADECFDMFVKNGQEVGINEQVTREYLALRANQKSMALEIHTSGAVDLVHVGDGKTQKLGELIIDMSDTSNGINRKVKVSMFFGRSEAKVEAIEVNSGKKYEASIKFEGDLFEYDGVQPTIEESANYHVIFANDISGSMTSTDVTPSLAFLKGTHNNCLGALYESCHSFLQKRSSSSPSDIVSCIVHHHDSIINFEKQPISTNLVQNHMMKYKANGGNDFLKVMQTIEQILQRNTSTYTPIAIFMTDGIWNDDGAANKLQQIMDKYGSSGFTLHVVALGPSINNELMNRFATIGKGTFATSSFNLSQLKGTYEKLAGLLL